MLIVGAPGDNGDAGAAYVYRDAGAGYAFEQKLTAFDANGNEEFGHSVALGEDLAVVGAVPNVPKLHHVPCGNARPYHDLESCRS